VLTSPVDDRLNELIVETAEEHGGTVHLMEVTPDHVHLFVEAGPTFSVAANAVPVKNVPGGKTDVHAATGGRGFDGDAPCDDTTVPVGVPRTAIRH
jgi:Transposase IS200 like